MFGGFATCCRLPKNGFQKDYSPGGNLGYGNRCWLSAHGVNKEREGRGGGERPEVRDPHPSVSLQLPTLLNRSLSLLRCFILLLLFSLRDQSSYFQTAAKSLHPPPPPLFCLPFFCACTTTTWVWAEGRGGVVYGACYKANFCLGGLVVWGWKGA